jgi:hypothetical protein
VSSDEKSGLSTLFHFINYQRVPSACVYLFLCFFSSLWVDSRSLTFISKCASKICHKPVPIQMDSDLSTLLKYADKTRAT